MARGAADMLFGLPWWLRGLSAYQPVFWLPLNYIFHYIVSVPKARSWAANGIK